MPHHVPIDGELDLHCFSPRDVTSVVEEYLRAAAEAGRPEVRIIHGRGIGVQRRAVRAVLERDPSVAAFWDAPDSHLGATVVRLRPAAADTPPRST